MPHSFIKKSTLHMKGSQGPKSSAHEVDFRTYTVDGDQYIPWITKLNKHKEQQGIDASILEVAFSEIALLFIKPGLTPPAKIVVDDMQNNLVVAVASENFNMQIKRLIDSGKICYAFDPVKWRYEAIPAELNPEEVLAKHNVISQVDNSITNPAAFAKKLHLEATSKAVNFLDKMPPDFFATLMKKHQDPDSGIVVDMQTLASILSTSFILEEDDLHKGNIGFYVTLVMIDGIEKKQFNFFKIDHDLMFAESIMAQKEMRLANILYTKESFKISSRDLEGFPDLKDSGNHYWPTQKRVMTAGDKAYKNSEERDAFVALKNDPAFNDAKWKYFLKAVVIPVTLVQKSLTIHLDPVTERDKIDMISNAISIRIGGLKQQMLDSRSFRQYIISDKGKEALNEISIEVRRYLEQANMKNIESLMNQLEKNFDSLKTCVDGDSSLSAIQKSIRLDNYTFSSIIKPTDADVRMAINYLQSHSQDKKNPFSFKLHCIAADLIKKSDNPEQYHSALAAIDQFKKDHLALDSVKDLKNFERAINQIKASDLPLKQQKFEIFSLLKKSNLSTANLVILKNELQRKEPLSPSLKVINQLRSELWIIKKLRGLYGKTTTSSMMINEIDRQLEIKVTPNHFKKQFQQVKNENENEESRINIPLK